MISNLEPHKSYQDTDFQWLNSIPEHWKLERAKWLFQKMDRPILDSDGVVTCFRDGMVTLRKNRRLSGFTEAIFEFGYQGIRKGDLVIHAMDAFAGAIGVSDSDGKGTPVYSVCRPRENANAFYYAYIVREMARSQWILALSRGIRERSTDFRFDAFACQWVPLPPIEEQSAIVRFLDWANARLDRAIRAKRKVIALLNEQKQAIIHRAVTRGLDPNVRMKDSGIPWLGEIPEHWEIRRVKQVTKILRGKFSHRPRNDPNYYGGLFPFIQTGSVAKSSKFILEYSQTLNEKGLSVSKLFRAGTLVMTIAANIGDVAILTFDACFPDSIVGFLPSRKLFRDYLFLVFGLMKPELLRDAPVNTQGNLNVGRIGAMEVPLPTHEEQEAIVKSVELELAPFEKSIRQIDSEIQLLREYRTRLVADVVTGKLDVREAASRLPSEVTESIEIEDLLESEDSDELASEDVAT